MKKLSLLGTAVLCTIFLGCSAGSSSPDYSALLINTEKQTPQSSTPSKPQKVHCRYLNFPAMKIM